MQSRIPAFAGSPVDKPVDLGTGHKANLELSGHGYRSR